ncbi:MAG: hypothetical protein EAZ76_05480 [Nostocales cyanobacterium]|nr:MAG: hypothetical protein EAZ87_15210 [Nostocales cyanobacterium]TAF18025.1 MAG: hypothetical protein EAZ76_05480 [Nostocales cyanobacterium]
MIKYHQKNEQDGNFQMVYYHWKTIIKQHPQNPNIKKTIIKSHPVNPKILDIISTSLDKHLIQTIKQLTYQYKTY